MNERPSYWGTRLAVSVAVIGLSLSVLPWSAAALAEEIAAGTIVSAANIDALKNSDFEGHRLGELLTERIEWQVRNSGLRLKLKESSPPPMDPRIAEATRKYSSDVRLDPSTFAVTGYKAGIPFPNVDPDDPHAGIKVIWNLVYGQPHGDNFSAPFVFLLIDGTTGLERSQIWRFARFYNVGRYASNPPIRGDGSVFHKSLLFAEQPQDIKGLGTFTIRYTNGRLDDLWAYVRTVRRVRRLSGGAWFDTIGGTDLLQDDIETFNAHPTWYKSYRLLGKRWLLAVMNGEGYAYIPSGSTEQEKYPRVDLNTAPYWNINDVWEPRQIFVTEAIPPTEHPYSKRIVYTDAETWRSIGFEAYDKKGDFWKWGQWGSFPWTTGDGYLGPDGKPIKSTFTHWVVAVDFQRNHASFLPISAETQEVNVPNVKEEDYSLTTLEAAGR